MHALSSLHALAFALYAVVLFAGPVIWWHQSQGTLRAVRQCVDDDDNL